MDWLAEMILSPPSGSIHHSPQVLSGVIPRALRAVFFGVRGFDCCWSGRFLMMCENGLCGFRNDCGFTRLC